METTMTTEHATVSADGGRACSGRVRPQPHHGRRLLLVRPVNPGAVSASNGRPPSRTTRGDVAKTDEQPPRWQPVCR
jgi:hypothetical protein